MKLAVKRLPWSSKSIVESISAALVFLFLYTALSKLNEQNTFVAVLGKSPLLGTLRHALAWGIPLVEIALSILLIIPKTRKLGLLGSLLLMTLFTLYLIYMVIFTPKLPCSCGGVLSQMSWTQHIFFNLFFVVLSAIGLRMAASKVNKNTTTESSNTTEDSTLPKSHKQQIV